MCGRESSELVDFLLTFLTLFICLARLLFYSDETRIYLKLKVKKKTQRTRLRKLSLIWLPDCFHQKHTQFHLSRHYNHFEVIDRQKPFNVAPKTDIQ